MNKLFLLLKFFYLLLYYEKILYYKHISRVEIDLHNTTIKINLKFDHQDLKSTICVLYDISIIFLLILNLLNEKNSFIPLFLFIDSSFRLYNT